MTFSIPTTQPGKVLPTGGAGSVRPWAWPRRQGGRGMAADIFTDPFHHCAVFAFVEQAVAQGGWPDAEPTRQRTYKLYENEKRKESLHD